MLEHLVEDQVNEGTEHDADEEYPPLDGAEDPGDDKGGQGGRHDAEESDNDDHVGAVARLVAFFDLLRALPLVVGGEQVIHRDTEDLRELGEDVGIRDGLAALPFGNRLVRIVQLRTELRLRHAGGRAQVDDVARRDQLQFSEIHYIFSGAATPITAREFSRTTRTESARKSLARRMCSSSPLQRQTV